MIHGAFSTNCICAVPSWKPEYSGSVTRKLTSDPMSANQRTICAWLSRPNASRMTPITIGVQMARLNQPIFLVFLFYLLSQTKYVISTKIPRIITSAYW